MRKSLSILFIISIFVSKNAFSHNDSAYYHGDGHLTDKSKWQNRINDNTQIRSLSIPGTHNSASFYGGDIVQNQSLPIPSQLSAGVRFLDIRLRHINDVFAIHHGVAFQNQFFGDVLNKAIDFLSENPSEFIFMRIKKEHTEEGNSRTFNETLYDYLNNPIYRNYLYTGGESNPIIKDVRGKIFLLNDGVYGGVGDFYQRYDIQDEYSVSSNWDLHSKWIHVKNHIEKSQSTGSGIINQLAASGGSFPYFIASGHSSNGTSAPRLLTGLTTPGWSHRYPDFPRVSCFIGICSIAFEGVNTLTKNHILNTKPNYVGIVVADFPGEGLIDAIINVNEMETLKVFEDTDFGGRLKKFDHSTTWVGDDFNDIISSMVVPKGFVVKAFQHKDYQGDHQFITGNSKWVGDDLDNQISSLKLYIKGQKTISSNVEINSLSQSGSEGFDSLLIEYNAIDIITQDGKWAPNFTLPNNAELGDKINFRSSATYSSKIYFNNKHITLTSGNEVNFVYDGFEWNILIGSN